jgi:transposase
MSRLIRSRRNDPGSGCCLSTLIVSTRYGLIKKATEDGLLGDSAKCATMRPNSNAADPRTKLICVYTYDVADDTDCGRIREALRNLGITWKIPYKTNAATSQGRYAVRGHRAISARFE